MSLTPPRLPLWAWWSVECWATASNDLQARTSERLADRRIKKNGDHIAIDSMFAYSLDNHLYTQFKVGVAAAPSVSFSTPAKLDADRIDQWQRHLEQVAKLPRDYLSPDELIRYQELSSYERMLVFTPPSAYAP